MITLIAAFNDIASKHCKTFATAPTAWRCMLLLITLSACGTAPSTSSTPHSDRMTQDSSAAPAYWETLNKISNGNATQQADVFYEIERDYTNAPTTANTLRYALALVAPAHPTTDPVRGKKLLAQLLANPERLTPTERSVAAFLSKDAEIRLQLEAENRRLTATVDERPKGQSNSDRRLQTLVEENAKLRKQLDDAQRKLDAIKSIEINTRERNTKPLPATGTRDGANQSNPTQSTPTSR